MKNRPPFMAPPEKSLLDRVEDALLPMINLVFLMLIFFIIAGQTNDRVLPSLPDTANAAEPIQPDAHLIIQKNGDLEVDGQTVSERTLAEHLPAPSDASPLVIAGAGTIPLTRLESVFDVLEGSGHTDVLLLTEPGQP